MAKNLAAVGRNCRRSIAVADRLESDVRLDIGYPVHRAELHASLGRDWVGGVLRWIRYFVVYFGSGSTVYVATAELTLASKTLKPCGSDRALLPD